MSRVSIGVVAEGKTDFEIIRWSLGGALAAREIEARFHALQPTRDRTSGTYGEGGWRQVYQWCLRNPKRARQRLFGGGLFAGDEDTEVDVILVHVDGDLLEAFSETHPGDHVCRLNPVNVPKDAISTFDFCQSTVSSWLFGEDQDRDACVPATAVLSAEAWLIGGLGYHSSPETLQNPKLEFARLWLFETNRPVPPNIQRLRRNAHEIGRAVSARAPDFAFAENTPAFLHAVTATAAFAKA